MKGQKQRQQEIISTKEKREKILVIDDEPDIALTFKLALEYEGGFDVDTFYQPRLALASFEAGVYDIVLLDFNMPILNGFQLYTELRKIDNKVKICFITASVDVGSSNLYTEISQSVTVGCFIQKPIENHELFRRIKAELRN
jgi:DNA-binding response OmpR family regulator